MLKISGADALPLLQGLVTCDMDRFNTEDVLFGALLAPQGKIQFDFFLHKDEDAVLVDIDKLQADAFLKRMKLYKLRSDVVLEDVSENQKVVVGWDGEDETSLDPRHKALGTRQVVSTTVDATLDEADYHSHRRALGVPEAGKDFAYNDIFPHDAMMDKLTGVDFTKGCYVGQEVVSRMKHRGTARKGFFILENTGPWPEYGTSIMRGEQMIGSLGSVGKSQALALLRKDRLGEEQTVMLENGENADVLMPDYAK